MTERDYTAAVIRLGNKYDDMQVARKRVADDVRLEFKRRMRAEIEDRQREIEYDFARELAAAHAQGLPGSVIRSEVLHTQDWARWKKWRDLAEIEPERVTRRNASAEAKKTAALAKSPFRWSDDYATLTVVKDSKGRDIEPVVFPMSKNRWVASVGRWWPTTGTEYENGLSQPERAARKADAQFSQMVSDEIQARIDAGEVPEP